MPFWYILRVMYKLSFIMVLAVGVFLTPFLGLPSGYQAALVGVMSVCILVTAYSVRKEMKYGSVLSSKENIVESPLSEFSE